MENRISIELPATVEAQFNAKLNEALALISPYVVTVSDDAKKGLLKLGDVTTPFVKKAEDYSKTDPEYAPKFLDLEEFYKDTTALYQFDGFIKVLDKLSFVLDDTRSLLANDSYSEAIVYYRSVKFAAENGDAKAKAIYEDLSKWFPGRPTAKKTA
jgi:hypothetical protein